MVMRQAEGMKQYLMDMTQVMVRRLSKSHEQNAKRKQMAMAAQSDALSQRQEAMGEVSWSRTPFYEQTLTAFLEIQRHHDGRRRHLDTTRSIPSAHRERNNSCRRYRLYSPSRQGSLSILDVPSLWRRRHCLLRIIWSPAFGSKKSWSRSNRLRGIKYHDVCTVWPSFYDDMVLGRFVEPANGSIFALSDGKTISRHYDTI